MTIKDADQQRRRKAIKQFDMETAWAAERKRKFDAIFGNTPLTPEEDAWAESFIKRVVRPLIGKGPKPN
jgi:hypothetical protein